ncbi:MAG: hypothetical protein C0478_13495 [Planctomyces sp.]|nr:hypothetical protein [Planctomyces sp.]
MSAKYAFVAICSLCLVGCSGVSDAPDLGLVTGTVTMEGEPLSGVQVTFQPVQGRPAFGVTNASGKYELTYIRDTRGCKIGPCKVIIGSGEERLDNTSEEGDGAAAMQSSSEESQIPARYGPESELTAEVHPGENVIDFRLTK